MKNAYDHHDHQDIYTYNLSVPKRFTLDVPNQSPPYSQPLNVQLRVISSRVGGVQVSGVPVGGVQVRAQLKLLGVLPLVAIYLLHSAVKW